MQVVINAASPAQEHVDPAGLKPNTINPDLVI